MSLRYLLDICEKRCYCDCMATKTLRMSDDLRAVAQLYADSLGVDLNALIVIALSDYLALRTGDRSLRSRAREMDGAKPKSPNLNGARGSGSESPRDFTSTSRNAPCPCGSGKKYKRCHGQEGRL
jgi:hypothetical protein